MGKKLDRSLMVSKISRFNIDLQSNDVYISCSALYLNGYFQVQTTLQISTYFFIYTMGVILLLVQSKRLCLKASHEHDSVSFI